MLNYAQLYANIMKYILRMPVLHIRESCNIMSLYNYKNAIPRAELSLARASS
jgi:hypothetical protein